MNYKGHNCQSVISIDGPPLEVVICSGKERAEGAPESNNKKDL